MNEQTQSVIN